MAANLTTNRNRAEALAAGLRVYDPGRPCRSGHLSPRYAKGGGCVECFRIKYRGRGQTNAADALSVRTCVYVIEAGGRVKIGIAENLKTRLQVFRVHSPFPVSLLFSSETMPRSAARLVEKQMHKKFMSSKSHGEWFAVSAPEVVAAVKEAILFG